MIEWLGTRLEPSGTPDSCQHPSNVATLLHSMRRHTMPTKQLTSREFNRNTGNA